MMRAPRRSRRRPSSSARSPSSWRWSSAAGLVVGAAVGPEPSTERRRRRPRRRPRRHRRRPRRATARPAWRSARTATRSTCAPRSSMPPMAAELELVIEGPDGDPVTDYDVEHDKELHLVDRQPRPRRLRPRAPDTRRRRRVDRRRRRRCRPARTACSPTSSRPAATGSRSGADLTVPGDYRPGAAAGTVDRRHASTASTCRSTVSSSPARSPS